MSFTWRIRRAAFATVMAGGLAAVAVGGLAAAPAMAQDVPKHYDDFGKPTTVPVLDADRPLYAWLFSGLILGGALAVAFKSSKRTTFD